MEPCSSYFRRFSGRPGAPDCGTRIRGLFAHSGYDQASLPTRNRNLGQFLFVALFPIIFAYTSLFHAAYIDDAYIELQYAKNLIEHHTWGLLPGRIANTATSPLNVLITAGAILLFRSPVDTVVWLTAIEFTVMLALLASIAHRLFNHRSFAVFAFLALVTNPLLVSTIGLEGILYALLTIASVHLFLAGRWVPLVVILGLLTLTRPEGVVLFAIYLVVIPIPLRRKAMLSLIYAMVLLPWLAYSWVHLGSLIPDTLIIKSAQPAWDGKTFFNGILLYWQHFPTATVAALILVPLGLPFVRWCDREGRQVAAILGVYAVILYIAYSGMRVPPYHWYYMHQIVPALFISALGLTALIDRAARAPRHLRRAMSLIPPLVPIALFLHLASAQGLPFREPLIHSNWGTAGEYKTIGLWLRDNIPPDATILLTGEIGTLAFYSERQFIDPLSDFTIASTLIVQRERTSAWPVRAFLRVDTLWRRDPPPLPAPMYLLRHSPNSRDDGQNLYAGEQLIRAWDTATTLKPSGRVYLVLLRSSAAVEPAS